MDTINITYITHNVSKQKRDMILKKINKHINTGKHRVKYVNIFIYLTGVLRRHTMIYPIAFNTAYINRMIDMHHKCSRKTPTKGLNYEHAIQNIIKK